VTWEDFCRWMKENHPDLQLTPLQRDWVKAFLEGKQPVWVGGQRSGRTFTLSLVEEYAQEKGAARGGEEPRTTPTPSDGAES
jgi:hypothetical protein